MKSALTRIVLISVSFVFAESCSKEQNVNYRSPRKTGLQQNNINQNQAVQQVAQQNNTADQNPANANPQANQNTPAENEGLGLTPACLAAYDADAQNTVVGCVGCHTAFPTFIIKADDREGNLKTLLDYGKDALIAKLSDENNATHYVFNNTTEAYARIYDACLAGNNEQEDPPENEQQPEEQEQAEAPEDNEQQEEQEEQEEQVADEDNDNEADNDAVCLTVYQTQGTRASIENSCMGCHGVGGPFANFIEFTSGQDAANLAVLKAFGYQNVINTLQNSASHAAYQADIPTYQALINEPACASD